jgi:hypothetical protein
MIARRGRAVAAVLSLTGTLLYAQTPRPFPQPPPARPSPPAGKPPAPPPQGARPGTTSSGQPDEATLGVPLPSGAEFVTSYDAGRGQRFYLFGVDAPFAEVVLFYRTALKQRGDTLFESPPTHQFETGRFRDETMAFPPSVTIKDYTWGGSAGYPNPRPGGEPARFRTIVQVVPAPPGAPPPAG